MSEVSLEIAKNGAAFTVDFFQHLMEKGLKENIIFSPASVQLCAALAFAGASGETAAEIARGMRFGGAEHEKVGKVFETVLEKLKSDDLLKIANKVYIQEGKQFKENYENALKTHYHAETEAVNFAESTSAAENINTWVSDRTAGKITELISPDSLDDNTRLVLLNALHFKGQWAEQFKTDATEEDDFWISEEESLKVNYMNHKAKYNFGFFEELDCQALEMSYADSDLSMFVLLPSERSGLKTLLEKIREVDLIDLSSRLSLEEVVVKFPKFKAEFSTELSETFQKFGVNKMFTDDAEFDNMLESSESLFVSKIIHKACLEVNEEGCEAAAATGMVMMTRMMMLPTMFIADRPFLYMIWNRRNILFAGAFVTPEI